MQGKKTEAGGRSAVGGGDVDGVCSPRSEGNGRREKGEGRRTKARR